MPVAVRITPNFERNLAAIRSFLAEAGAPDAYNALLDTLAATVIPNLERYPRIGQPFLERAAHSVEARERIGALRARTDTGELREYMTQDHLILYALSRSTVYLLAIKHHRQLSFDLEAHWVAREAIASYVARAVRRRRGTLEALADVKGGRTRAHAAVESWAAKLGKPKRESRR